MAGLLGRLFGESLAVASAIVVCLALTAVDLLVRLTAVIVVITVTPAASLMPLSVCEALNRLTAMATYMSPLFFELRDRLLTFLVFVR